MANTLSAKYPDEVLDYSFDWSARLGADTIVGATVVASGGLVVSRLSYGNGVVTYWLSGGTAKTTAQVTCEITTATGRVWERIEPILIY